MKFTYESYSNMLKELNNRGYQFATYQNWRDFDKTVILRHDVDNNLKIAATFSGYEKRYIENGGGVYILCWYLLTFTIYTLKNQGNI